MRTAMAALFLTGTITLSLGNLDDKPVVLEHDVVQREACLVQLLAADQAPYTAGTIIGTLNYADKQYGGPCAALDHYRTYGWY